jgi:hypothetical protein
MKVGRGDASNREGYEVRPDEANRWHWTGNEIIHVHEADRALERIQLTDSHAGNGIPQGEPRPEPPALPEDEGSAPKRNSSRGNKNVPCRSLSFGVCLLPAVTVIAFGAALDESMKDLADALQEPFFAQPFLLRMPVDELASKYRVEVVSQQERKVRLRFFPRENKVATSFRSAELILERSDKTAKTRLRPKALMIEDPPGQTITVHTFSDVRINLPVARASDLAHPDLAGYTDMSISAYGKPSAPAR